MGNEKKFYKALLKEPYMKSKYGDMVYHIGVKYTISKNKKLSMCNVGYHYTDNIFDLSKWYDLSKSYVFEVLPEDTILYDSDDNKYCSRSITIVRQLSDEEIHTICDKNRETIINGSNTDHKTSLIELMHDDKDLDILINDREWLVREEVAKRGRDKDLDILVNDEDWIVREIVASHGRDKDLDILVNDKNRSVRREVAKHGRDKDLDILVNDKDDDVRREVAKRKNS